MWTWGFANTTLSPVTVQRFAALQGELIGLVEQDYTGLNPANLSNHPPHL